MTNNTKEFHDLMLAFEAMIKSGKSKIYLPSSRLDRESKDQWAKGYYYQNGDVNSVFIAFMNGYQMAKSLARIDALPLEG